MVKMTRAAWFIAALSMLVATVISCGAQTPPRGPSGAPSGPPTTVPVDLCDRLDFEFLAKKLDGRVLPPADIEGYENGTLICARGVLATNPKYSASTRVTVVSHPSRQEALTAFGSSDGSARAANDGSFIAGGVVGNLVIQVTLSPGQRLPDDASSTLFLNLTNQLLTQVRSKLGG